MSSQKHVLVTGATGQQGGAAVEALLKNGHTVRGLTRSLDTPKARQLAQRGVEVVAGDFTDADSLLQAATDVDAIYAMTTPFEKGMEAETAQGIAIINAAKQAGVSHLVYSSVGSANLYTKIPHFDSKYAVEKELITSDLPYTIIGPVYFMENLLQPWVLPGVLQGKITMAMPGDRKLQQIAVANIGSFAAALIERGDRVLGQRIDIAGDDLTNNEAVDIISEITGRRVVYEGFPPDAMRAQNEDMAIMFEWFDATGYSVDIEKLRADFPEVAWMDYRTWAQSQNWAEILSTPVAATPA